MEAAEKRREGGSIEVYGYVHTYTSSIIADIIDTAEAAKGGQKEAEWCRQEQTINGGGGKKAARRQQEGGKRKAVEPKPRGPTLWQIKALFKAEFRRQNTR